MQEVSSRRCRWINRIQEFNIDIQITKLVRGQGLEKLMAQYNLDANQIIFVCQDLKLDTYNMDQYESGRPRRGMSTKKKGVITAIIRYLFVYDIIDAIFTFVMSLSYISLCLASTLRSLIYWDRSLRTDLHGGLISSSIS